MELLKSLVYKWWFQNYQINFLVSFKIINLIRRLTKLSHQAYPTLLHYLNATLLHYPCMHKAITIQARLIGLFAWIKILLILKSHNLDKRPNGGYWGKPEQAPHWLKSAMVSYLVCMDSENDKIQLTSHSSFVMVSYVACTDCENDKIRWTSYLTFHTPRVQTVSVEGLMKWGKRDLDDEENVTREKERN